MTGEVGAIVAIVAFAGATDRYRRAHSSIRP